jgi:uncharacterized membrane protein YdjX (TVP38/TMEM64 family)
MQTHMRQYRLSGLILVGFGVILLTCGTESREALTVWGTQLGSWGSCMLMGLYSMAPSLHSRGAALPMTGKLLCGAILGMAMLLMGTTVGGMGLYLLVRGFVRVRWTSRVPRVTEAVSIGSAAIPTATSRVGEPATG